MADSARRLTSRARHLTDRARHLTNRARQLADGARHLTDRARYSNYSAYSTDGAGYLADDVPPPATVRLQLNALQALCRQTFGVRLVMLALGAPFSLANTPEYGASRVTVLCAAVLGIMASYAMLRDWDRFGPRLLAHPALMVLDLVFVATLLLAASSASPLAYATVCTPLLTGLLYGWRATGVLTGLQLAVLGTVFRSWEQRPGTAASTLLVAGFCIAAGIVGVTLRNLVFRFGAAGQALSEANARLAVAEAVESERARLAREMHDSVAKTLHGLALAAQALADSADHCDPAVLKRQATTVAQAARTAAAESRALLSDLRGSPAAPVHLAGELTARLREFTARTGVETTLSGTSDGGSGASGPALPYPNTLLPPPTAHHVLSIVDEALENIHRHAHATRAVVELAADGAAVTLRVADDGGGFPAPAVLEDLARSGHFGLLGLTERAAVLGGRVELSRSPLGGAEVTVRLPLPTETLPTPQKEAAHA
ncbi:integral membrane sensor signal transduction histidine kinase [Actinobacteria bacterium OK074]|nr:integral membrane sensor signal transduction histidine kinase [Actinobacteria bacterium OK074]